MTLSAYFTSEKILPSGFVRQHCYLTDRQVFHGIMSSSRVHKIPARDAFQVTPACSPTSGHWPSFPHCPPVSPEHPLQPPSGYFLTSSLWMCRSREEPNKHETLNQCWVNVGPSSTWRAIIEPTLVQCLVFAGSTSFSSPAHRDQFVIPQWSHIPANTRRWPNVDLMVGQRLRRWTSIT